MDKALNLMIRCWEMPGRHTRSWEESYSTMLALGLDSINPTVLCLEGSGTQPHMSRLGQGCQLWKGYRMKRDSCQFPKCRDGCKGHPVQRAVPRGRIIVSQWGASMVQQQEPLRPLRRTQDWVPTPKQGLVEVTI